MRAAWRAVVDFVVGDDLWIAVAVLALLGVAAIVVHLGGDAWWVLPLGVPAASAVKIEGERAYRLLRRGVAVEMPLRRSRVDALDVIAYTDGIVTLDLRVSSGTYVRAIAEALGGHCVALRRLEVGPFSVADADEERVIPAEQALARLP